MRNIRSLIIVLAVMLLVPCLMPYNGVSVVNLTPDKIAAFTENFGPRDADAYRLADCRRSRLCESHDCRGCESLRLSAVSIT